MSEKLCVVMPVYNEQDAIGPVLEKWAKALDDLGIDYAIRPYNDGSKDNSLNVMKSVAEHLARVEVRDKKNGGHGNTILTGYRDAAADGFDWVFQIDSDDEMGPEKFGELWAKRGEHDFLVGIRDGRIQQLPRKIISFVSRLCVRLFYGKSVWDVNTPYRLMRASAFREFYQAIPLTTFAPNVILSGLAARHKLRSYEIRVPQHDRTTGEVSIKKWKLLKAAVKSFAQTVWFALTHFNTGAVIALSVLSVFLLLGQMPVGSFISTDSAVYQLGGKLQWLGKKLYVDFFDHKGPFIYYINSLGYALTRSYMGTWLLSAFMSVTGIFILFFGLRKRLSVLASFSLCVAVLSVGIEGVGYNGPEAFAVSLICASMGLMLLYENATACFVVGIMAVCVFMMKQTLIGFYLALGVWLLIRAVRDRRRTHLLAYIGGGVLALSCFVMIMLWQGILSEYFRCCFAFNACYANANPVFADGVSARKLMGLAFRGFEQIKLLLIFPLVAVSVLMYRKEKGLGSLFLVGSVWFFWDMLLIVRGGRAYGYQFAPLRICLVSCLIPALMCGGRECVRWGCLAIGFIVFVNFTIPSLYSAASRQVNWLLDRNGVHDVQSRIVSQLNGDVPLFIWDNACRVYFETDAKCPVGHYYWTALSTPGWICESEANVLIEKLRSTKPLLIIDGIHSDSRQDTHILSVNKWTHRDSIFKEKLRAMVKSDFHQVDEFGTDITVYLTNGFDVNDLGKCR